MSKTTWIYTFFTYAITWSIIIGSYCFYKAGKLTFDQLNLLYNLGALGPFLGAIITAKIHYGKAGIKKIFSTFNLEALNKKSLLISFSPLFFFAVGLLIYPLLTGHSYSFSDTQRQFQLTSNISYINWILPFISYCLLEEFGWRAFLLPHLQEQYSAFKATVILTAIWAIWHLPFFLWRFQFSFMITIGFFFSIFVGAIIITTLFNLNKGSIIPVILFHFSNNLAAALDKEYIVAIVSIGFIFLAIYLVKKYKITNLSDTIRVKNFYLAT